MLSSSETRCRKWFVPAKAVPRWELDASPVGSTSSTSAQLREKGTTAVGASPPSIVQLNISPASTSTRCNASGCTEESSATPVAAASPSSTRSGMEPTHFSNVAHFWRQRAAGRCNDAPVPHPLVGADLAPVTPALVQNDPGSVPIQHWRLPTPRSLVNFLDDETSADPHGCGSQIFTPCASAISQQCHGRTPSTSTTLRTPISVTTSWEASSGASILAISTPEKFSLESPEKSGWGIDARVRNSEVPSNGDWGGETEMELMLDLVNHVPCNMMDRLTDALHSPRACLRIEEELTDALARLRIEEERTTLSQNVCAPQEEAAAFLCVRLLPLCKQLLRWTVIVGMLALAFAAGFIAHDRLDGGLAGLERLACVGNPGSQAPGAVSSARTPLRDSDSTHSSFGRHHFTFEKPDHLYVDQLSRNMMYKQAFPLADSDAARLPPVIGQEPSRVIPSSGKSVAELSSIALTSDELEQECLAAASHRRARGMIAFASEDDLLAEYACYAAAVVARGRETAMEGNMDSSHERDSAL